MLNFKSTIPLVFSPVVEPPVANGAVIDAPPADPLSEAHGSMVLRVLLPAPLLREYLDISRHLAGDLSYQFTIYESCR